jgi:stage III sporulation protein SpoIIIAA
MTQTGSKKEQLARLKRAVFAVCRERGIRDDLRREIIANATGKSSLTQCTITDLHVILDRLSGQSVYSQAGMMHQLAAGLEDGPHRLAQFALKRFKKLPDELNDSEIRSCIGFLRHVKPEAQEQ